MMMTITGGIVLGGIVLFVLWDLLIRPANIRQMIRRASEEKEAKDRAVAAIAEVMNSKEVRNARAAYDQAKQELKQIIQQRSLEGGGRQQ